MKKHKWKCKDCGKVIDYVNDKGERLCYRCDIGSWYLDIKDTATALKHMAKRRCK